MSEDDRYAPLREPAGGAVVIAQLGQSLDGRIATVTGHSHYVTGDEDRRHLHLLRALVDAVVVGGRTVAADNPQLTVREVAGCNPLRVVLDPRGRLPADRHVFLDCPENTLLVLGAGVVSTAMSRVETLHLPASATGFDPAALVTALARRGRHRLLIEGGGRLVSACLAAGVLDYLYLSIAPVIIGSGVQGLELPPVATMGAALRPQTRRYALGSDTLFRLDLRAAPS
jgi:diaminohydroxyphosphoribosylaminopyrimidine deaminase / 5-amino-6-(5-phosphoribosylamino)uracil reductase